MQKTVDHLLATKGRDVWSIDPGATVFEALQLMADKGIGAVAVLEEGRLVGILSERDYARKVTLFDRASRETAVRDIMTDLVFTVEPSQTVTECMTMMTEQHIRHLPVVEGDVMVGIVSIGDVVKAVISEQAFLIEQLEHYIKG
jgi:CBS domain-containing protein